ncbi:MAG: PIN domain-containing protein [Candidatus Margulisiibacteriota bacterium]
MMKKLKIYLDTSVINFLFADDAPEYRSITEDFFHNFVKTKKYETYISNVVIQELELTTNEAKRNQLLDVIKQYPLSLLEASEKTVDEIEYLGKHYIQNKIIPENKLADALHIAYSVVFEMDILLSWNFKHLANYQKEKVISILNQSLGYYYPFRMTNPTEVIADE